MSPTEFQVSGFNNFTYPIDGTYTFTVSTAGVVDLAGNTGTGTGPGGTASDTWVMDTNPPDAATNLAISPDTGSSATDGVTDTGNVTLTGTVDQTGLLLEVYDGTTELVTDVPIQGESISAPLTLAQGSHDLRVDVVDAAAGVSADAFLNVLVDPVAPAVTIQPVTPSVLAASLASATISFSKPVYGFTLANLRLTNGGGPNLLPGSATLTSSDDETWTLGNLIGLTGASGNYTLALLPAGIEDTAGSALSAGGSISFAVAAAPTVSIAAVSPNPRTTPVNSLTITFSDAVSAFTPADLTLSDNGGTNLLSSAQALTTSDNVTWTLNNLAGLTGADGNYVLTLLPAGITDGAGESLAAGASTSFLIGSPPPTSSVSPLPAVSVATHFTVDWSGQAYPSGNSIASFDVYVQDDGGPFTLWQSNTTATSEVYTGVPGNTYGFYSVATDQKGNQEVKAAVAEASTLVQIATTTSLGNKYPSGAVYGQAVTLTATVSSTDPAVGTPGGTVQFQIDGANVGAPAALASGTASIVVPGLNAANYQITASYSSNTAGFSASSGSHALPVNPAPVVFTLQSNLDWLLAGQELSIVAVASTTATSNGMPLAPDGTVTFYDNGVPLDFRSSLAVVDGQEQAVFDTTTLAPGRHLITVGYASASGNFAMTAASPVLTEIDFPGRCDRSDGGQYEQRPDRQRAVFPGRSHRPMRAMRPR